MSLESEVPVPATGNTRTLLLQSTAEDEVTSLLESTVERKTSYQLGKIFALVGGTGIVLLFGLLLVKNGGQASNSFLTVPGPQPETFELFLQ